MEIRQIGKEERVESFVQSLLEVWESSVRATHDFLRVGDVEYLRPFVEQGLKSVSRLFCAEDNGKPTGFLATLWQEEITLKNW